MIRTHRRPQSISLLLFTLLNYRLRAILNGRLSESIRMLLDGDVSLRTARFLFASSMTSAFYLNIEYIYYEVLRLSKHGEVEWPVMIRMKYRQVTPTYRHGGWSANRISEAMHRLVETYRQKTRLAPKSSTAEKR